MCSSDLRDPYFVDAAKLLIDKEKGSIGMLQRYFKVGFNRAARIMDQLEEAGIDTVMEAVRCYVEKIKREGTDEKYIMHGSTFFNGAWKDYIEPAAPAETLPQAPRRKSF